MVVGSVADPNSDPDPPDPHDFGPPGSGSGAISHRYLAPDPDPSIIRQNSKKNLDFYCFVTFFILFTFQK
jgi:hypothetical protein